MRKYFEFYSGVKINCGESALMTIGTELERLGCERPLFLSSQNAEKLGVLDKVKAALPKERRGELVVYSAVSSKVDTELVSRLKEQYEEKNCDGVIAIGGDGVMDTAKCLKLFLSQECDEIIPLVGAAYRDAKKIPMIAIPTENGSGKEASGFFESGGYYVSSYATIPDVVIIDEDVAMAAPARTIAACGAYAFANAVEGFLGAEEGDPAEIYAEKAIRLLAKNLEKAVKDDEDEDACRLAALAATYSGIAYGQNPFGAAHALAEALSEMTGEPIEEMFSVVLIPAIRYTAEGAEGRVKALLLDVCDSTVYAETPDSERAKRAITEIGELLERLREIAHIPTKISQTKITRESFGDIAEAAANKRSAITSFRPITKEDFLKILNDAY